MGMMLRRHNRKPDYTPQVNGKPVKEEPKKRSLTKETKENMSKPTYSSFTNGLIR